MLMRTITSFFFSEITIIGAESIPKDCPVIICGNHANQFVDAMMIVRSTKQQISFLIAQKSMERPVIGHVGRALGAIPVQRPQDLAKNGKGKIISVNETISQIQGEDTKFTQEIKVGDSLMINELKEEFVVKSIESDLSLTILEIEDANDYQNLNSSYKITPKVDQNEMFEAVWKQLVENKTIGIFPEGGSHDNPDILPLKAGVCIMALGAMAKYNCKVKIVTCGLNYYEQDKFRSQVVIEYSKPFEVSDEILQTYKKSKREGITLLLNEIELRLRDVLMTAPSYKILNAIYTLKNLYIPNDVTISKEENIALEKKFGAGVKHFINDQSFLTELEKIVKYNETLKALNIEDKDVQSFSTSFYYDLFNIIISSIIFLVLAAFACPGYLLLGPVTSLIDYLTEKERLKALAGSKVKIKASDVVASYQILLSSVLFPLTTLTYLQLLIIYCYYYVTQDILILIKYGVLYLIFWPVFVFGTFQCKLKVTMLSEDHCEQYLRQILAKGMFIFNSSALEKLKDARTILVQKVQESVSKYGQQMDPNFEQNRILKQLSKKQNRRASQKIEIIMDASVGHQKNN